MILQEMKIGDNIVIKTPILPAPMCGISDKPFRKILSKFGSSVFFSEMIASSAMVYEEKSNTEKEIRKSKDCGVESVFGVQIAGYDPNVVGRAAEIVEANGADIVDLNFGCPVKKVVNTLAGSALMKDEELCRNIIEKVVGSVKIPVTIKMRMGWDLENLNAPKIAKIAADLGVKMITIHGRTRNQMYNGIADWNFVSKVKNAVSVPVIVNGDIKSFDDVQNAITMSNADGVMIGRGFCGKPWLFGDFCNMASGKDIAVINMQQKANMILEHVDLIEDHYGEKVGIGFAKKHLFFYSKGYENGSVYRQQASNINDFSELKKVSEEFLHYTMIMMPKPH